MKKLALTLTAAVFGITAIAGEPAKKVTVDTDNSNLEWVGEKVTGKHWGTVNITKGYFDTDGDEITGGEVHVDMTSITVNDMKGDNKQKLEGHLKSDDFFSVEKHNTTTFVLKNAKKKSNLKNGNTHELKGDLTIKGITETVTFPARVTMEDGEMNMYASFELDRTRWDVRYGSGSFFDDLGDKTIYDDFQIKFNVTAK